MSKYHIEIVISEGDPNDDSRWKTVSGVVVSSNDTIDQGNHTYPLDKILASLEAVRFLREVLEDNE